MPTFPDDYAGGLYLELINDQLQRERDRKTSLEQKGLALVTAAGTLVTLVFGFTTFVRGADAVALSAFSEALFVAALFCFVVAAMTGILSNLPFQSKVVKESALSRLASEPFWSGTNRVMAGRHVAVVTIKILTGARKANDLKAVFVVVSVSFLAAAALLLAATAASVAVHGS